MTSDALMPVTPEAALARLTELVDYIRVSFADADRPATGDWTSCSGLARDPDALYRTMRSTMDAREIERDDIGMSLIVQGYGFRIASVAIGAWLISGGVVDVSPENVSIQFGRNRPNAVRLDRAAWVAPPSTDRHHTLAVLHQHLVDEHLATIIETSRRACRVGARMMWANVATSCASSFGALMDPLPEEQAEIRADAERFFSAGRPELNAAGDVIPIGSKWAWQRNACCLYYLVPNCSKCGDCSLHTPDERAARYAHLLEEARS